MTQKQLLRSSCWQGRILVLVLDKRPLTPPLVANLKPRNSGSDDSCCSTLPPQLFTFATSALPRSITFWFCRANTIESLRGGAPSLLSVATTEISHPHFLNFVPRRSSDLRLGLRHASHKDTMFPIPRTLAESTIHSEGSICERRKEASGALRRYRKIRLLTASERAC